MLSVESDELNASIAKHALDRKGAFGSVAPWHHFSAKGQPTPNFRPVAARYGVLPEGAGDPSLALEDAHGLAV